MAPSSDNGAKRPPPVPGPGFRDLMLSSLGVGGASGLLGGTVGYTAGLFRSQTPVLFAAYSSVQWFVLGSSFYASRGLITHAWGGPSSLTPSDKVKASALAGGSAGLLGSLLRGPRNILPAALIFSALGAAGQSAANLLDTQEQKEAKSLLARKWSPIKPFSDEDYKAMLEEKLLGIEADIALLDEKIAAIRAAAAAASESERKDGR